jgi:hypothetical protein
MSLDNDAPSTFPKGTAQGNQRIIGQRCTVWLPDKLGKEGTPSRVIRFGRVLGTDGEGWPPMG